MLFHSWAKEQKSVMKIPFWNESKTNAEKTQVWRDKETVIYGENGLQYIGKLFSSTNFFIHSSYADLKVLFHKSSEFSTILSPTKCIVVRVNQVPEDEPWLHKKKKNPYIYFLNFYLFMCAPLL